MFKGLNSWLTNSFAVRRIKHQMETVKCVPHVHWVRNGSFSAPDNFEAEMRDSHHFQATRVRVCLISINRHFEWQQKTQCHPVPKTATRIREPFFCPLSAFEFCAWKSLLLTWWIELTVSIIEATVRWCLFFGLSLSRKWLYPRFSCVLPFYFNRNAWAPSLTMKEFMLLSCSQEIRDIYMNFNGFVACKWINDTDFRPFFGVLRPKGSLLSDACQSNGCFRWYRISFSMPIFFFSARHRCCCRKKQWNKPGKIYIWESIPKWSKQTKVGCAHVTKLQCSASAHTQT